MKDECKNREQLLREVIALRKHVEARTRETEEQIELYENLIRYSATPTFVIDSSHRVLLWNKACEEMTNILANDITGTNEQWKPFYSRRRPVLADLIIDQNREELVRYFPHHRKSRFIPEGLQAEGWYPNIGGVNRYLSFNAAPIRNNNGEIVAAVETFEDLTEMKMTEKRLFESEKRYRVLFDESPAVMLVIDPQSVEIIGANEAAFSYYGYTKSELIGKSMTELIAQPSDQVFHMLREATNGVHLVQLRHRLKSGKIRDVELSRGPIRMNGDTYLFSIINDITDRKTAEEAAREGESKLAAITSLANDAIILVDDRGSICYWNLAAEKMFGYNCFEMMGQNVESIMPQRFRARHRQALERFVKTGHGAMLGRVYEVSALRKDGSEVPIELSISGLQLKGKWHSAGVIRDITGRRNLELQLRQAQKMEALGTFAGGIAHDFNNMLTVIIGHGTMLSLKMPDDHPLLHHVQQVLASADRASSLTQSLLAFSRKSPLQTQSVN